MEIFGDMPEGMKDAIREALDQQSMILTSSHHDVQRLFSELSVEHLKLVISILAHLGGNGNPQAAYLQGLASGALVYKHNICSGCGRDHDKEAEEELAPPVSKVDDALDRMNNLDDLDLENALKYNVSFIEGGKVRCNGCHIEYPNLADRMLKATDNCSGCHQKSAWG